LVGIKIVSNSMRSPDVKEDDNSECVVLNALIGSGVSLLAVAGNRGPSPQTIICPGFCLNALSARARLDHIEYSEE